MSHYTQLTIEQRYQIFGLKKAGFNQSKIASGLNVHKSTISRELMRNKGQRGWPSTGAGESHRTAPEYCGGQ